MGLSLSLPIVRRLLDYPNILIPSTQRALSLSRLSSCLRSNGFVLLSVLFLCSLFLFIWHHMPKNHWREGRNQAHLHPSMRNHSYCCRLRRCRCRCRMSTERREKIFSFIWSTFSADQVHARVFLSLRTHSSLDISSGLLSFPWLEWVDLDDVRPPPLRLRLLLFAMDSSSPCVFAISDYDQR